MANKGAHRHRAPQALPARHVSWSVLFQDIEISLEDHQTAVRLTHLLTHPPPNVISELLADTGNERPSNTWLAKRLNVLT